MQGVAALVGVAITVLALIGVIRPSATGPGVSPSPELQEEALTHSVVQVQIMAGGELVGWGSGTVISDDGLVLTNAHVAIPSDVEVDELVIAVTQKSDAAPVPTYRAEVVAADSVLDLAILRITHSIGGGPYDHALLPLPIGDSSAVAIGDELIIVGYPGIGGETVTLTRGYVSGFTSNPTLGSHAWIKTDGTIAGGNSGGLAANTAGELIGVPTLLGAFEGGEIVDCRVVTDTNHDEEINDLDECVPLGGFLNRLRPINLVLDLLAAVDAGVAYEPLVGLPDPVDNPNPVPTDFGVGDVRFGRPIFDDIQPPDDADVPPNADPVWLASGTNAVCGWWEYSGMADGVSYDAIWSLDGVIQEDVSFFDEVWIGGESGWWWVCNTAEPDVQEGMWFLTLNVAGELITGSFVGLGDDLAPVTLTLHNDGPEEICYLYVSPSTSTAWGADRLGLEETLVPGASFTTPLPPATYDLLGVDCDDKDVFEDRHVIHVDTELTY
jgi:S1-C subfamily serine protease